MEKKRVIVDYKNITSDLLALLTDQYPDGYDEAVIKYMNAKGDTVQAVPLETEDTKYLFKISTELTLRVEQYLDDLEEVEDADVDDDDSESTDDND